MGDLASQILWGTGFENVLDFDYPELIDDKRFWRRPGPGSARARNPAGTTDAAVYGYDYMLAGRARWFGAESYSNPVGLQALVDWAGRGNAFRFVPDKNAPDFYVDNCYLEEPFDDPAPDLEQADGSQSLGLVIRNATVDFGQALRGIMFEYAPGASLTDPVAATFTRATAATRRGLPSASMAAAVGASDASGVLRDRHYEGAVRTTLLEAARTQLVTDPENFGAWGTVGTIGRTAGQADPFGGTGAYLLDSNAAGADRITQNVPFTGDATKAIACFMRANTSTRSKIAVYNGTVFRHSVLVNWAAGVPSLATSVGTGTLFSVVPWGGGWYGLAASADAVVATDTNQYLIYPDDSGGLGSVYVFGANAWDAPFPSSYQGPSLVTRNTDALSFPYLHKPQALFCYVDLVERGTHLFSGTNPGQLSIGEAGSDSVFLMPSGSPAQYGFLHRRVSDVSSFIQLNPAIGDRIQLLGLLAGTGTVQVKGSKNDAAEVVGSVSGASALAAAWTTQTLLIGRRFPGDSQGFAAFARVKIGPLTFGGVTRDTIAKAQQA